MKHFIFSLVFILFSSLCFAGELSVDGTGVVSVEPDEGYISLGVVSYGEKSADVVKENSKVMTDLFAVLAEKGVDRKNIQTTNFSLEINYKTVSEPNPDNLKQLVQKQVKDGFVVRNNIRITVCELKKFGEILDAIVSNGANTVNSIQFGSSKSAEYLSKARKLAVADALHKANLLSEGLGVKLATVLSVTEYVNRHYERQYQLAPASDDSDVPVFGGSLTFAVSVQVRWDLAQKNQKVELEKFRLRKLRNEK